MWQLQKRVNTDRKKEHRREYILKARIHSYGYKKLALFYQDTHIHTYVYLAIYVLAKSHLIILGLLSINFTQIYTANLKFSSQFS